MRRSSPTPRSIEARPDQQLPSDRANTVTANGPHSNKMDLQSIDMTPIDTYADGEELYQFRRFPAVTMRKIRSAIKFWRETRPDRKTFTILMLGRSGAGKSSTVNSMFGEMVCTVNAFQPETGMSSMTSRYADGVVLRIIDTPGFLDVRDSPAVNVQHTENIRSMVRDKQIDCVFYVDRLDSKRVDPADQLVLKNVTNMLGKEVWRHAVVVLTRGCMVPPDSMTWSDYVKGRTNVLINVIRGREIADNETLELPYVIVENSKHCPTNSDREAVLPDGIPWLPNLFDKAFQVCILLWFPVCL